MNRLRAWCNLANQLHISDKTSHMAENPPFLGAGDTEETGLPLLYLALCLKVAEIPDATPHR